MTTNLLVPNIQDPWADGEAWASEADFTLLDDDQVYLAAHELLGIADQIEQDEEAPRFEINSEATANWFVDKVRGFDTKIEYYENVLKHYEAQVEKCIKREAKKRDFLMHVFGQQLLDYTIDNLPRKKDGELKTKTMHFVAGSVQIRPTGGLTNVDEKKFKEFLSNLNPEEAPLYCLKTKFSVHWNQGMIKEALANNVDIPGWVVEPENPVGAIVIKKSKEAKEEK